MNTLALLAIGAPREWQSGDEPISAKPWPKRSRSLDVQAVMFVLGCAAVDWFLFSHVYHLVFG